MNFLNKNILVITDGSQGMLSQVEGLAKELNKNFKSIKTNIIFPWSKIKPGIIPVYSWIFLNEINFFPDPDIVISCGRKSVYLSIFLRKKNKEIISIHIQDPKINFNKFDFIVAPEHDGINGKNVIKSIGALHKFSNESFNKVLDNKFNIPKENLISVIVGGNNNHYIFSNKEIKRLVNEIQNIKLANPKYNFLIIHSRRTSQEMKDALKNLLINFAFYWEEEKLNPYEYALKHSNFFIVTSDSTSMISECAYTGKSIYVYHLPFKRKSKRIEKFHNQFEKLNITKKLEGENYLIPWTYKPLNESKRIASIIKERIIKEKHEVG